MLLVGSSYVKREVAPGLLLWLVWCFQQRI